MSVKSNPKVRHGKMRWAVERKDGKTLGKYNVDGSKNVYHHRGKTLDRSNIKTWGLTNEAGNAVAVMDVPEGAVVFQRRRNISINYRDKWYDVEQTLPPVLVGNKMLPERKVKRRFPEQYYDMVWIHGWRKREADGSVTVSFKAVYPDGRVEDYTAFGVKPWLYEPLWFSEEQV